VQSFITPCGSFDNPVSHFRTALLTVAMALSVVFCILLLCVPAETDKIMLDLGTWQGPSPPVPRPLHQLVIDAQGRLRIDGGAVGNRAELLRLLEAQQTENPVPDLQIEPHPQVRYEDFLLVLAVIKRAHVYRMCVDFDPPQQPSGLLAAAKKRCTIPAVPTDSLL